MKDMIKETWNRNFNKGVSFFQLFLMVVMVVGGILGNQLLIFFSMFNILLGYFEPNQERFSLELKRSEIN